MITTERLLLRPFCEEDLSLILRLYSNEEILRYTPLPVMDEAAAKAHLDRILREWEKAVPGNMELAVISKETGEALGRCHIQFDEADDAAMIGWLLLESAWGKGYGTEAALALREYCFHQMGLHRIYALCHPDNARSRHVLEKCGLRLEAHFRQKCRYAKGGSVSWQDELVYAMLSTDF